MEKTLEIFRRIVTHLIRDEQDHPVAPYIPSQDLFNTLDLSLGQNPIDEDSLEKILESLVIASPKTASKSFFNQLFGGRNEKAVLGDLLSVVLNNSMYTYKAAGPQIGVEKIIIRELCHILDWNNNAGGIFAPGGSMANFMSMIMARDRFNEKIKRLGIKQKLTIYTSEDSHYSIAKNAAFSGIGRENVRYVKTDVFGKMDCNHLMDLINEDIQNGSYPILVNLTMGTTVSGAFDPIKTISAICKKHHIWLHVDGAYCGSVIFSNKYKYLLEGIEEVDSFCFNAHKMIGTPISCSIILVKDKIYLTDSFSNEANYLYQTDHDDYNLGKISLQCGRRNDALKFWTLWKSVGTTGLENIVDHQFYLSDIARDYVRKNQDYTLYSFDNSISICFNYKNISAKKLCTQLYEHSKLLVGYGTFKKVECIRLVTVNVNNQKEDILEFFKILEDFVENNYHLFSTMKSTQALI